MHAPQLGPLRSSLSGVILALAVASPAAAQDLEPRAYTPSPPGVTFLAVSVGHSTGSLLFDPTLPVTDAQARINNTALVLGRAVAVKGRAVTVAAVLPFAWGDVRGNLAGEGRSVSRSGLADLRLKISTNLAGLPGPSRRDVPQVRRRPIVGTSLTIVAPTGQYRSGRVINLGLNRWAFKPEVGVSVPRGRWDFEAYGAVWLFTANHDYYPGGSRQHQDPLTSVQTHVAYTIRPRLWLSAGATWFGGGQATVNDGPPINPMSNSRLGATFALPVGATQSLKFSASTGLSTQTGSDFDTFAVTWQIGWIDKPRK